MPKTNVIWADIKDHYSKEELAHMVKDNTLPTHLQEVYEEAKSFWYHCGKAVLKQNAHRIKADIEISR